MQVRPGHGQNERWTEGPGTETEQSKDMETQGECNEVMKNAHEALQL